MKTISPSVSETMPDVLTRSVCKRLTLGEQIRESLPNGGRLHIDRPLPFLCVYRFPCGQCDESTERLVTGEASYLIVPDSRLFKPHLSSLILYMAKNQAERFKAFLIIEIWSTPTEEFINEPVPFKPHFTIVTSKARPPTYSVEALEKALKGIRIHKQAAVVELMYSINPSPTGLTPLIPYKKAKKINCFIIGLKISPIYRDPKTNTVFPVVLRTLHRGLSLSLKRAFFKFSHVRTIHRPSHYYALGRRATVKAVWEADKRLSEISRLFDFLLQVTPVNGEHAWAEFKKKRFEQIPTFFYRPLPVDSALLKRKLYKIPLEHIEDQVLAFLFREKRLEIDRKLTMLGDRGTIKFLYGSLQLYGIVNAELRQLAETLLKKIPARSREGSRKRSLNAKAFADLAMKEIEYYRRAYPALSANVQIRDDTVGLMVSQGNLLIGHKIKIPLSRVEALLNHEVGIHILTYFNGKAQPFHQLYCGLAGYEELQEGLAVLAEYIVGGLSRPRLRLLAGRVVAAQCIIDGASFIDTFRRLNQGHGFEQKTAFTITLRIYRGGGLTKDAVYLRGLVKLLQYIREGGKIEPLFVGKIAADHVAIIKELQLRKILRPIPLHPHFMDNQQAHEKLQQLKGNVTVLDLIERKKNENRFHR